MPCASSNRPTSTARRGEKPLFASTSFATSSPSARATCGTIASVRPGDSRQPQHPPAQRRRGAVITGTRAGGSTAHQAAPAVSQDGIAPSIQVRCTALTARQVHRSNLMASIPVGARGSFTLVVTPEHLANRFKDATLPPVLATPVMIMVMENAALNAIKPFLGAGESALGTHVDVRHLAATPAGRRVTGEAEVTGVDGRRIEFTIRARDGGEEIGVGTH